jgi:predicted tellurium resistance membrane protein TerC
MMSFENEAALIIISHGNVWIAWLGILVTSPLIFFVSHLLTWLLDKYAFILYIGSIVLIKIGLDLIFTMKPLTPYVPIAPWAFTGFFAVFVSVLYIKEPLI